MVQAVGKAKQGNYTITVKTSLKGITGFRVEALPYQKKEGVGPGIPANADSYRQALRDTLEPLKQRLADVPDAKRWLATCEGAFSYLAQDLGLRELYLWPMNADQVGTPQQIRTVVDTVRAQAIPAVFCESTVSDKPARQVARETGARYGGVLYVDSLSTPDGPVPSYLDLLRVTTETIVAGLTGER